MILHFTAKLRLYIFYFAIIFKTIDRRGERKPCAGVGRIQSCRDELVRLRTGGATGDKGAMQ